jgi:hypothetical protein
LVEYSTDLVFRSEAMLRPLYVQLRRQAVLSVKAEHIWMASRSQRCARSRCASLRSGSAMELAALKHLSARARNLLPVILYLV